MEAQAAAAQAVAPAPLLPSGEAMAMLARRIRPDWDITDPQLRAAWKAGDKSRFWPYGKSLQQVLAEQ